MHTSKSILNRQNMICIELHCTFGKNNHSLHMRFVLSYRAQNVGYLCKSTQATNVFRARVCFIEVRSRAENSNSIRSSADYCVYQCNWCCVCGLICILRTVRVLVCALRYYWNLFDSHHYPINIHMPLFYFSLGYLFCSHEVFALYV